MSRSGYQDSAIVYVASGRKYVAEAAVSALSARRLDSRIKIYLKVSDPSLVADKERELFDVIQPLPNARNMNIDKATFLEDVAESKVVFLDGDTFVCGHLDEAFDLLTRFEFACAHAPGRISRRGHVQWREMRQLALFNEMPAAFCELNTGVMFTRNTERMRAFFRQWAEVFEEIGQATDIWGDQGDQSAMRALLWKCSDISTYVLPPEYNARIIYPVFLSGYVRIIHARVSTPGRIAKIINENSGPRVFLPEQLGLKPATRIALGSEQTADGERPG